MFKWLRHAKIELELQEMITGAQEARERAEQIRNFLLKVLQEDTDGKEKFNDEILQEAAELIEEVGPGEPSTGWQTSQSR
jgi:hypothetical protein